MGGLLRSRELQGELLDDPALDEDEQRLARAGLARLNRLSGASASLWRLLQSYINPGDDPLRVLDLACAAGDVIIGVAQRARAASTNAVIAGCDINPAAIREAGAEAKRQGVDAEFLVCNVVDGPLPAGFDVLTCLSAAAWYFAPSTIWS